MIDFKNFDDVIEVDVDGVLFDMQKAQEDFVLPTISRYADYNIRGITTWDYKEMPSELRQQIFKAFASTEFMAKIPYYEGALKFVFRLVDLACMFHKKVVIHTYTQTAEIANVRRSALEVFLHKIFQNKLPKNLYIDIDYGTKKAIYPNPYIRIEDNPGVFFEADYGKVHLAKHNILRPFCFNLTAYVNMPSQVRNNIFIITEYTNMLNQIKCWLLKDHNSYIARYDLKGNLMETLTKEEFITLFTGVATAYNSELGTIYSQLLKLQFSLEFDNMTSASYTAYLEKREELIHKIMQICDTSMLTFLLAWLQGTVYKIRYINLPDILYKIRDNADGTYPKELQKLTRKLMLPYSKETMPARTKEVAYLHLEVLKPQEFLDEIV